MVLKPALVGDFSLGLIAQANSASSIAIFSLDSSPVCAHHEALRRRARRPDGDNRCLQALVFRLVSKVSLRPTSPFRHNHDVSLQIHVFLKGSSQKRELDMITYS